ncbi:MAG TPA: DNA topoisomerase IB [Thermodesulfobacteriota bacterium]|nr:DNA topoisomerase IB [Thermodesulfobacteriota bacterium]
METVLKQEKLENLLSSDPEEIAKIAGLRYVSDQMPGFRRKRWGRGFTYIAPNGEYLRDPELRQRFEALAIPPAWTDVWICPKKNGHIQATGRDDRGRKQYVYHPHWEEIRNLTKFGNMISFSEVLPLIREHVDKDLSRQNLSREKVLAVVVWLLEETLIRVGNTEYKRDNKTFGLTTLSKRHLDINGSNLFFVFRGKGGKKRRVNIQNRRLAHQVKRCQELPGQELFQYIDGEGEYQTINSGDVNEYLRGITGQDLTAKYFRTWGGTVIAASELYNLGPAESKTEEKRKVVQAVKLVAKTLGNTPSVCRNYYIHPEIINAYLDTTLFTAIQKASRKTQKSPYGLGVEERAVANLLRSQLR